MENIENRWYSTGKRKTCVARVWMTPGSGVITVNNRTLEDYFFRATSRMLLIQPLELTNTMGEYDFNVTVRGGGLSGQADAIKYGIAKVLVSAVPDRRDVLKKAGFLTRDSRIKERKKYGQPGARKKYQYSKR